MPVPALSPLAQVLTFHYLPRELCIHIKTDDPPDIDKAIETNRDLMSRLNPVLQAALDGVKSAGDDAFNQDYSPSPVLWPRCRIDGYGPLKELARWPMERRFVLLDNQDGTTDALHFFAVEVNPIDQAFDEQDRAATIRDLVNLINRRFRPFPTPPHGTDAPTWKIVAATPNWLANPCDNTDGGNPGTPPEPVMVPPKSETFRFGNPVLDGLIQSQRTLSASPAEVVVAVLDTSPSKSDVTQAGIKFGHNPLIGVVTNPKSGVQVDGPLSPNYGALQQADFNHLADFVPNWSGLLTLWQTTNAGGRPALRNQTFATADHGLFIAGIIKDIAPRADVHLIRVLDNCGMGDLLTLTFALSMLPGALVPNGGRRLIVNLSLSIDVPLDDDLLAFWFPLTARDQATQATHQQEIADILDLIHSAFKAVIDWLLTRGHLVVASTGNDALGRANPPEARLPARYPGVLSVAAINRQGNASAFSNQATNDGVAILGGDAAYKSGTTEVEIRTNPSTGRPDAVVGIYEAPTLPFNAGNNTTGWAFWAGTSFAAPIVSALAAVLCMPAPIQNAQLIQAIQGCGTIGVPTLVAGTRGIFAFQI